MTTNTKENGFESLIVDYLINNNGYELGEGTDYNREFAIDETRLFRFLQATQQDKLEILHILDSDLHKSKFLNKLKQELAVRGIIDVLRNGMRYLYSTVDFDSYKNNILEERAIILENEDSEIEPIPVGTSSVVNEPEPDTLSNILKQLNSRFGDVKWSDSDKVKKQIAALPEEVAKNEAYQNAMKNSDKATAKIESDAALIKAILQSMTTGVELFKEFQDNPSFKKWLQELVFTNTYNNEQPQVRV